MLCGLQSFLSRPRLDLEPVAVAWAQELHVHGEATVSLAGDFKTSYEEMGEKRQKQRESGGEGEERETQREREREQNERREK